MEQAEGAIHPLFYEDVGRPHVVLDVVALATVGHGPIPPENPAGPQGQPGPHLRAGWQGPMQIGRVRRRDGQAHLLDQPILQGVKEPFDAALGLRRVRENQLDAQIPQRPSKLTRRGDAGSLLLNRRFRRGAIGRMLIGIHGQGNPILLHVPLETVEGWHCPFILIEAGIHQAARIIDVGHQHTARAAPLEPIMMGAIQLHQFAAVRAASPPRAMGPRAPPEMTPPAPAASAAGFHR